MQLQTKSIIRTHTRYIFSAYKLPEGLNVHHTHKKEHYFNNNYSFRMLFIITAMKENCSSLEKNSTTKEAQKKGGKK